jgi:hypothetical protein
MNTFQNFGAEVMQTEIAVHSGRDSLGAQLQPGPYVVNLGRDRRVVQLSSDPVTDDLGAWVYDRWVRVDEIDPHVVFSRLNNLSEMPCATRLSKVNAELALARSYREGLAQLESGLASELGCVCGDGSPLWEGISAAVRDGVGTAVDLLDLAGALRR